MEPKSPCDTLLSLIDQYTELEKEVEERNLSLLYGRDCTLLRKKFISLGKEIDELDEVLRDERGYLQELADLRAQLQEVPGALSHLSLNEALSVLDTMKGSLEAW